MASGSPRCLRDAGRRSLRDTEPPVPHVALVCEYDALRGLGHCVRAHLIATSSAGAGIRARAITQQKNNVDARVTIVGAPAEEGGGGKNPSLSRPACSTTVTPCSSFIRPTAPRPVQYAPRARTGSWTFRGKAAHAAGNPDTASMRSMPSLHAYNGVSLWRAATTRRRARCMASSSRAGRLRTSSRS